MKFAAPLNACAFVAGFVVIAAALSHAVPSVRPPQIGAKLDWLEAHGEEYDTFFIGSSRVHRQIIPDLFDAEMAALGVKTNSFNLSGDGMRPPEDEFVMERAFAGRAAPVRLLLVECNPLEPGIADDDGGTARTVYWHDASRMMRLWRNCWTPLVAPERSTGRYVARVWKRLRDYPEHIQHWAWNAGRLGEGNERLVEMLFGLSKNDGSWKIGADGYNAPKTAELMSGSALRAYQKDLAVVLKSPPVLDHEDEESQVALAWKKALAEKLGARLVLIGSPYVRGTVFAPRDRIPFLNYSNPAQYPELYAPENRRDPGHLNVHGSEIYTRLIARHIAAVLKSQP